MPSLSYQDVVFNPDAAEAQVFFDPVIIDEIDVFLRFFPLVDEGRDEISPGFDGENKTWLELLRQPEIGEAELIASFKLVIIADIILTQVFHIMNVQTKHMPEAVGEEERVGAVLDGFIDVALHEPDLFEAGGDCPGLGAGDSVRAAARGSPHERDLGCDSVRTGVS